MSKLCPYCSETIADSAKKCRFCGEWLPENMPVATDVEYVDIPQPADPAYGPGNNLSDLRNAAEMPVVIDQNTPVQPYMQQQPMTAHPYTTNMQGQPQVVVPPIIINNDITQNTEVDVDVEQTVNVVNDSNSSSGWLYFELICVAGAVWWGTGMWWIGLITFFALCFSMQVPVLGHAICIILGLGVGLLSGIVSAAFGAPVWASWLIGIVIGIAMCSVNLSDRNADD